MSEGTMDDTSPAEPAHVNAARLVTALCDEFSAQTVVVLAMGQLAAARERDTAQ